METTARRAGSTLDVPARSASRVERWPRWLREAPPAVAFGAVFVVAGAALLATVWRPVGDYAVTELILRNAVHHPPLVGPYSSTRGMHHPLPWVYALLWLPYTLSGDRSSAQLLATVWWNGAGVVLILWLTARRRAIWLGVAIVAGIALYVRSTNLAVLMIPWNPNLAFVAGVTLIVAVWRICLGSYRLLPLAAGLVVWCAGAHVGFIPMAAALGLVAVIVPVVRLIRAEGRAGLRRLAKPAALSAAVVFVMVLPAMIDLAVHGSQSNPVALWRWFLHPRGSHMSGKEPVKALFGDVSILPSWISGRQATDYGLIVKPYRLPVLLLPVLVAVALAWRRRATDELVGIGISSLGIGVAFVALYNVTGATSMVSWFLFPIRAAIICLAGFTVWSLGRSIAASVRAIRGSGADLGGKFAIPLATVTATALALAILPTLRVNHADSTTARAAHAVVNQVERRVPKDRPILLSGGFVFDGYNPQAVALEMVRAGYQVRFPAALTYIFGPWLTSEPAGSVTRLLVNEVVPGHRPPLPAGAKQLAEAPLTGAFGAAPGTRLLVWRVPKPQRSP